MPARSRKQKNVAQMALALQQGSLTLEEIPQEAREAVQSMAAMPEADLEHYLYLGPSKKRKTALGKGAR
jgi:hypothetical protein